jgi:hypothetical protein
MFAALGLVTLMRIPVLIASGLMTMSEVYNCSCITFLYTCSVLGKKVYFNSMKLKVILGLLFVSVMLAFDL